LNDRAAIWEEKMESIERGHGLHASAGSRGGAGPEGLVLEVKRANEVLRQLSLPWEELLQAVESAAGREIALLALEPDTEKQVVKISGEARDMAGLLDYITRLEEQKVFGPVFLQSHQVQLQDPERPVRFSLLAVWKGKS
jgi:dipeptidyl aminopeptidase/acylaminoacyl peptidase